jgi:hypothetical protein
MVGEPETYKYRYSGLIEGLVDIESLEEDSYFDD